MKTCRNQTLETARTILECVQFSEPVELIPPNALIKCTKCFKNLDSVLQNMWLENFIFNHDPLPLSLLLLNVTTQNKCLQISLNLLAQMLYTFFYLFQEIGVFYKFIHHNTLTKILRNIKWHHRSILIVWSYFVLIPVIIERNKCQ